MQRRWLLAALSLCGLAFLGTFGEFRVWGQGFGGGSPQQPDRMTGTVSVETVEELGSFSSAIDQRFKLLQKLSATRITVNFDDVPLREAILAVAKLGEVPVVIDDEMISSEGQSASLDKNVTYESAEISVKSALALLLEPGEFDWIIQNEMLTVTTKGRAERQLEVAIYDIQNLIGSGYDSVEVIDLVTSVIAPETWDLTGGAGSIQELKNLLIVRQSQRVHDVVAQLLGKLGRLAAVDVARRGELAATPLRRVTRIYPVMQGEAEKLVEMIPQFIEPDSWKDAGGDGVIRAVSGTLVMYQTPEVHRQTRGFLQELRDILTVPRGSHCFPLLKSGDASSEAN